MFLSIHYLVDNYTFGRRTIKAFLILFIFLFFIPPARGELVQRIVSLAPSYTETLLELGLKDRLVGVTSSCNYLEETKDIKRVGSFAQPSLEKIVFLKPDLVLAADFVGQESIRRTLERLGIKVVVFGHRGVDGILEMVEEIGRLTDKEKEAGRLLRKMKEVIDKVKGKVREREKPRVYVEVGFNPLFTAGRGSHIHDLIEIAGGENIAKDINKPFPRVSQEFIIKKAPQVIILPFMGRDYDKESVKKRSGWENIPAVKNNRVYNDLGAWAITIPSPHLILKGLPELARRIHPYEK